jgi:hypothetical protein
MTVTETRVGRAEVDEAQLLFQEARERRRRRWLIGGVATIAFVALFGIVVCVLAIRGGATSRPVAQPSASPLAAVSSAKAGFSLRPVYCYAPASSLPAGQPPAPGPLPTCSTPYELTASHLNVIPGSNAYSHDPNIGEDPQFAAYPSTARPDDKLNQSVLLPEQTGDHRIVLGPAALTQKAIASTEVSESDGQWVIDLTLTSGGAKEWNILAQQQFHAMIAVVVGRHVVSAPITQPTQASFSPFGNRLVISGPFNEHQAKVIASQLDIRRSEGP